MSPKWAAIKYNFKSMPSSLFLVAYIIYGIWCAHLGHLYNYN